MIISFIFAFAALVANDLGSIHATVRLVGVTDGNERTKRGLFVTGLGNVLAGYLGVVGPVDFSLNTGVILSSQCASRYTLLPAALGLLVLAFTSTSGLIIGVPLMAGTMIAFLPNAVLVTIPPLLRPLIANSFVVGTAVAVLLEHLLIRGSSTGQRPIATK